MPEATVRLGQGVLDDPLRWLELEYTPLSESGAPSWACGFESRPEHERKRWLRRPVEWPPVCHAGDRGFDPRRSRNEHEPPRVERGPAVRRLVQAVRSCPVVPSESPARAE